MACHGSCWLGSGSRPSGPTDASGWNQRGSFVAGNHTPRCAPMRSHWNHSSTRCWGPKNRDLMGLFTIGIVDPRADSIGRCNTLILEAVSKRRFWSTGSGRRIGYCVRRCDPQFPCGAAVLALDRDRGSPQLRRQRRLVCLARLDFGWFRHAVWDDTDSFR